jgi:hypothetical protein
MVRLFDDLKEIYCLILKGRCSSSPKKKRNVTGARSKMPKSDYLDSKLFNFFFSFLNQIVQKLVRQNEGWNFVEQTFFLFWVVSL